MSGLADKTSQAGASQPSPTERDPAPGCWAVSAGCTRRGNGKASVADAAWPRHGAPERGAVTRARGSGGMSHGLLCLTATAGPRCRAPLLAGLKPSRWEEPLWDNGTLTLLFIPPSWNEKGCPVVAQHFQEQAGCRVPAAKSTRTTPTPESFQIQGRVSQHSVVPPSDYHAGTGKLHWCIIQPALTSL